MEDKHVAALLEDLRGQFKIFGEALQSTRTELGRRIDGVASDLDRKIDGVASDLGRKIDDVAGDVTSLVGDMADVKKRLTRVEHLVNGKSSPTASPTVRKRKK